jgi:nicotinate-nucleotide adenylyltransferase
VTAVTRRAGAERLGVLGGTFDPPHVAHLVAALDVRHELDLDRVLLVVANDPWQKRGTRAITPAADRLALVEAAIAGHDGLEADDREIRRGGASYTAETLEELAAEDPTRELFVVVGTDLAAGLATWHRPEAIAALATLVLVERPGVAVTDPPPGFRVERVRTPRLDISSTDLRARLAAGRPVDLLLPGGVATEIHRRRLYGC